MLLNISRNDRKHDRKKLNREREREKGFDRRSNNDKMWKRKSLKIQREFSFFFGVISSFSTFSLCSYDKNGPGGEDL